MFGVCVLVDSALCVVHNHTHTHTSTSVISFFFTFVPTHAHMTHTNSLFGRGFIDLGAGLSVGISGLAAGFAIGIVGDSGVRGTAQQPKVKLT